MVSYGSGWYYADGWFYDQNGKWYYLKQDGSMATGWLLIGQRYYYLNPSGDMVANGKTPDGYTVNADGAWTVNGVVQIKNETSKKAYSDNDQYPLAHLKDWFVLNSRVNWSQSGLTNICMNITRNLMVNGMINIIIMVMVIYKK